MTFGVDYYERAIARIFDKNEHVIGTGFLIAPGYILTCAHVVLQAIGIEKEEFATYTGKYQAKICLDFPVLATGQKIEAEVVAWLPYSLDSGDVAALKLLTSEPEGAKPIPLVEFARAEVEKDSHSVYGFGSKTGGRSDAYRPKANVAGGRFQLCKFGNPNDETIKSGFSGAPVWNESRRCVIGMVATAVVAKEEQQSTAYAIPTKELQSVLKKVDAFYLHDILTQSMTMCASDNEKQQLEIAINAALRRCNPKGEDRTLLEQLIDLSVDRAPASGWEREGRLVHFALMLARMDGTPTHTSEHLEIWVERCGFRFSDLFVRIDREMKQEKIPFSNVCRHLMVAIKRRETSSTEISVSMWAITHPDIGNSTSSPLRIFQEENKTLGDLPKLIKDQHRNRFGRETVPLIHLFVPRDLLCCDVEMQPMGKLRDVLGSTYPLVIRTNLAVHPTSRWYVSDWEKKWQQIEQSLDRPTHEIFDDIDCQALSDPNLIDDLVESLETKNVAILRNCVDFEGLFGLLAEEKDSALPVALWARDSQFEPDLPTLLDGIIQNFPERIQQERIMARQSRDQILIGHHLSLVWEDYRILPPDMQFDPEAC